VGAEVVEKLCSIRDVDALRRSWGYRRGCSAKISGRHDDEEDRANGRQQDSVSAAATAGSLPLLWILEIKHVRLNPFRRSQQRKGSQTNAQNSMPRLARMNVTGLDPPIHRLRAHARNNAGFFHAEHGYGHAALIAPDGRVAVSPPDRDGLRCLH
jgi:hypothetical protein